MRHKWTQLSILVWDTIAPYRNKNERFWRNKILQVNEPYWTWALSCNTVKETIKLDSYRSKILQLHALNLANMLGK